MSLNDINVFNVIPKIWIIDDGHGQVQKPESKFLVQAQPSTFLKSQRVKSQMEKFIFGFRFLSSLVR